jgi:F-type H+-transporting ATPase subunit gamma
METLEALQRRIHTVRELQGVVRTLKALSGATIRQYEQAVTALGDYYRTVELGLMAALHGRPSPLSLPEVAGGDEARVVIGTDQGLVGRFNEVLVGHALAPEPDSSRRFLVVGLRAAAELRAAGRPVEETLPLPGSVRGITLTVDRVLLTLDDWQVRHRVRRVQLCHNQPAGRSLYRPATTSLLPVPWERFRPLGRAPWPGRARPGSGQTGERLLTSLLRQFFFVTLFRACAESLACEHAARLATLQRASKNIDEHLQTLDGRFRQRRQTAITEELLDIVAGSGVLGN